MRVFAGVLAVVFVVSVILTTVDGGIAVLFGWPFFLARVFPEVAPDRPSLVVGTAAFGLFAAGVHLAGRSWRPAGRWTVRATAAGVGGVVLLFAAAVAMIGMTHQAAWLATTDRPLRGPALAQGGDPGQRITFLGIGVQNSHDTYQHFPAGGTFRPDGQGLHSWETETAAYLGYWTRDIDKARPWDDPANARYFRCVLPEFVNPGFRTAELADAHGFGVSHYAANVRVMGPNRGLRLAEITDGPQNTVLVGEVNAGFRPWGHPVNWRDPADGVGGGPQGFGGPPGGGGVRFLMADGSVRVVAADTDPAVLRALATPSAGDAAE